MKTLILHYNGSYHKFEGLYEKYIYEIKGDGMFYIYLRNLDSGEETMHGCFKKWDYFLIGEDL